MRRRSAATTKQVDIDPEILRLFQEEAGFDLKTRAVFVCYVGSRAHNTYFQLDNTSLGIDDTDVFCVVVPPPSKVYGLRPWEATTIRVDPWDVKVISLSLFTQLLLEGSPRAVEPLWTRESEQFALSEEFKGFITARNSFLSQHYFQALLREANDFEHDMLRALRSPEIYYEEFLGERKRALAVRNKYDTRYASHFLRRLKMLVELAEHSQTQLWRDDEGLLKAVKRGYFRLPEVQTMAERLRADLLTALPSMVLPDEADSVIAEDLLLRVLHAEWQRHADQDQPHTLYEKKAFAKLIDSSNDR